MMQPENVLAILEGRKTQTRRVVKHKGIQPPDWATHCNAVKMLNAKQEWVPANLFKWSEEQPSLDPHGKLRRWPIGLTDDDVSGDNYAIPCPYGKPGDRLWVRETFYAYGYWTKHFSGELGRDVRHFNDKTPFGDYRFERTKEMEGPHDGNCVWWRRPAIFMPRAASRITLEITDVRVERLQDISHTDCMEEGIAECPIPADDEGPNRIGYMIGPDDGKSGLDVEPQESYCKLWDSINGEGAWDKNPWVWALTFKRVEA